jgi:phage head maturation protease
MLPVATRSSPAPAAAASPEVGAGAGTAVVAPGANLISGYFATFGDWANIGGAFLERNAPDAFTHSVAADRQRVRAIFQHGNDPTTGSKPLGRILTTKGDGFYEVEPLDTSTSASCFQVCARGFLAPRTGSSRSAWM